MRIKVTSVFVDDQAAALAFYTDVLGFVKKTDVAESLWLTVVSPEQPEDVELLLEPSTHPAVAPYRNALMADGIPAAQFTVDDVQVEYERLSRLGGTFTQEPTQLGPITTAVFDDTCGNLINIVGPPKTP